MMHQWKICVCTPFIFDLCALNFVVNKKIKKTKTFTLELNSWILNSAESFSLKNCVLGNIGTLKGGKKRESKKSDIREEDSLKEMSVLLSPTGCLQRRHACCCHLWNVIAFLINFVLKSRSVVLSVSFFLYCLTFPLLLLQSPDSVHVGQVWPILVVSASIEMAGKALGTVMIVCWSASETRRLLMKWASLQRCDCIWASVHMAGICLGAIHSSSLLLWRWTLHSRTLKQSSVHLKIELAYFWDENLFSESAQLKC